MSTPHRGGHTGGPNNQSEGESVDVGKEISESIEPFVPWAVSVLVHAGVLLLTVFLVWTTANEQINEEPIVPDIRLSQTPRMVHFREHEAVPKNEHAAPYPQAPKEVTDGGTKGTGIFGPGPKGGEGTGTGSDKGPGGAPVHLVLGPVGSSTPLSFVDSGGSQFRTIFMDSPGGNVKTVVYLIDASGSLIDTLPFVLLELKRSINALSQEQSFTVIFFQGKEPNEVSAGGRGLKAANQTNKRQVIAWIDPDAGNVVPAGLSNPLKAMRLALSYKPDLIYLLSDNITGQGRYEVDQRELLRELANANRSLTKINTIQFIRPDPLNAVGMPGTMELIAHQMGGVYKYMGARELNIQ